MSQVVGLVFFFHRKHEKRLLGVVLLYVVRSNNDCFKQQLIQIMRTKMQNMTKLFGGDIFLCSKFTRNPKIRVSKRNLLVQGFIFRG